MRIVEALWWIAPIGSVLALISALGFYKSMMKTSEGTDKMKEIAKHVRDGAYAYLYAQYRVVSIVFIVLTLLKPAPLAIAPISAVLLVWVHCPPVS